MFNVFRRERVCLEDECVCEREREGVREKEVGTGGGLFFKLDNRALFLRPGVMLCKPIECI